ncbi:MAG: hypothetical protein OD918_11710 [Gammaproteobacteria bacterium]
MAVNRMRRRLLQGAGVGGGALLGGGGVWLLEARDAAKTRAPGRARRVTFDTYKPRDDGWFLSDAHR